jgi:hypothetical protein
MRIVITQNEDVMFLEHFIALTKVEGEGTDSNKREVILYGLMGIDVTGQKHELGLYDTIDRVDEVQKKLLDSIRNRDEIFHMPED